MAARYLPRLVDQLLARRVRHHPAVLIVGPRAAGKTTTAARLARTVVRLDREAEAAVVRANPDAAIRDLDEPILIDEWQMVPEVLTAVKRAVDTEPRPGRFIITGSVRGDIDAEMWPGTGRLLRVPMFGLTVGEIRGNVPAVSLLDRLAEGDLAALSSPPNPPVDLRDYAEFAIRGGFPEPVLRLPPEERVPWLDSYLDFLLTRDAAGHAARRSPQLLRRYVEAWSLNTGGIAEHRTIYEAAGISRGTGDEYEDLLRNLLIVDVVPGWWSNRLKRLVRAPKRYFVETSLALAAVRVDLRGLMRNADLLGRALDTLVAAQLRAEIPRCESRPRMYHLRQEQGRHEVDLIIEYGAGNLFGIEVKASSAPTIRDARHLAWLRDEIGPRFLGGAVLHTGPRAFDLDDQIIAAPIAALWS